MRSAADARDGMMTAGMANTAPEPSVPSAGQSCCSRRGGTSHDYWVACFPPTLDWWPEAADDVSANRRVPPGKRRLQPKLSPDAVATLLVPARHSPQSEHLCPTPITAPDALPIASYVRLMARFVRWTDSGAAAAGVVHARALPNSSPAGTTWLTIPTASARAASTLSSPSHQQFLCDLGAGHPGKQKCDDAITKRASGSPKSVPSAATVISQASPLNAPARQKPCTAATVGFGQSQNWMMKSKSSRRIFCSQP